jgi:hypothetical protein
MSNSQYPITLNGDHAEFEAEWAGKDPKTRPGWPLPSFDAKDWAEAFDHFNQGHNVPEGVMLGWFANSLMRGFDEMAARAATALAEAEARGRRQGLPDLTDMQVDMLSVQLATALLQTAPMEPGRIDPLRRVRPIVRDLYETIRSLATAPAETQKPETGEASDG